MERDFSEMFAADHSETLPEPQHTPDPAAPQGDPGTPAATGSDTPLAPPASTDAFDVPGIGSVTRDELVKGYLRQQDYTRKTMSIAQQAQEATQLRDQVGQLEGALQQVRAFLQNPQQLQAHLRTLGVQEPQEPGLQNMQPDQMLTVAEAQQLVKRQLGESEQGFQRRLQEVEERIVTNSYKQQFESAIESKLTDIGSRHPELRSIPGMEVLLREAVKSQKPRDINEALDLFERAGNYYAARMKDVAKASLVQPNNPLNRGIEPPNFAAAAPSSTAGNDFSGVKDPNLRNAVMKDLEAILNRQ